MHINTWDTNPYKRSVAHRAKSAATAANVLHFHNWSAHTHAHINAHTSNHGHKSKYTRTCNKLTMQSGRRISPWNLRNLAVKSSSNTSVKCAWKTREKTYGFFIMFISICVRTFSTQIPRNFHAHVHANSLPFFTHVSPPPFLRFSRHICAPDCPQTAKRAILWKKNNLADKIRHTHTGSRIQEHVLTTLKLPAQRTPTTLPTAVLIHTITLPHRIQRKIRNIWNPRPSCGISTDHQNF